MFVRNKDVLFYLIYIYTYIYIYIYIYIYVYIIICIFIYNCIYICVYISIYICIHVFVYVYVYICIYVNTANNAVFCLFCFFSPPLCCSKNSFTLCLPIFSNVMEKFDCNLTCPIFLHINFPMVLNDQKLWYFIKNEIFKIMTHS